MKHILVMGAGKIGQMMAMMLAESGDYRVTVADCDPVGLAGLPLHSAIEPLELDVNDAVALKAALRGKYAVLSALPFALTTAVARAAVKVGVHYLDLTEDVACTRVVRDLARGAATALVPQCGLAPGFISVCAHDLAGRFDRLQDVKMRVGALPKYPANAMKYALTWSTEGLINEYLNPCEAVVNGALKEVPPLAELEQFSLDGVDYEAFNTSGGLGTLCETLEGKVKNLNYRTVRYPGHRDILKLLLQDLRLGERPELVKDIFETALPFASEDVVLVFVSVTGEKQGRFVQDVFARKYYRREIGGQNWSAIQVTTAAGICGMLDMLAEGQLPQAGFVKQEDADFGTFINNRFGRYYAA
ncbi:MAG: saccharopine dehydrogenase NADP-binding domain-containing protein [Rhodobacteraceae bacterium]|nr:saccharopine dehydrogenase NADP-binding domain-containing protein [Paracoccaceae bacterium]